MAFVVFAGQSNIGGAFMDASTVPAAWRPDPLTLIWDAQQGAWAPMQPGVNTGYGQQPNAWGPEVQFAIAFRAQFPNEELRIVKVAHGGATLHPNDGAWIYDWSPSSRGEWFEVAAETIQKASAAIGGQKPQAVFWGQGEEDARSADTASSYASNLAGFFSAVRASWMADPAGRIVFFQINTTAAHAHQVRAAQAQVDQADPYALSFDAEPYPRHPDMLHYSAEGYQAIGAEFFRSYAQWVLGGGSSSGRSLVGSAGADTLIGGDGNDTLDGREAPDYLRGGAGDDLLYGGDGFDDLHGNQGQDSVHGGGGPDWVVGGQGDDLLHGDADGDVVLGNLGADTAHGGEGDDVVRGGQGDDTLFGGPGNDWMSGDRGSDTLTGGSGADTLHIWGEAGLDVVTDFNAAEGDRVYVLAGSPYVVRQEGAHTVVEVGSGGRMVLQNVQMSALPEGWIFSG